MNKQTKSTDDKLTRPKTSTERWRLRFAALAPTVLSAAVLVGALAYTKKPQLAGD